MTLGEAVSRARALIGHRYTTEVGESARLGAYMTLLAHEGVDCAAVARALHCTLEVEDTINPTRARFALVESLRRRREEWLRSHNVEREKRPAGRVGRSAETAVAAPLARAGAKGSRSAR